MPVSSPRILPEWYKIPEISPNNFLIAIKPIFQALKVEIKSRNSKTDDKFMKTIIMSYYNWSQEDWLKHEHLRNLQKVLEMNMGDFHETLAGYFKGYKNVKVGHVSGCDVIKEDGTEVWEWKNKENTMNHDAKKSVFKKLNDNASNGKKAYLVFVNAWTKMKKQDNFEILSGKEAYKMLSGRESFYTDLMDTLQVIFQNYKTFIELQNALTKKRSLSELMKAMTLADSQ